MDKDVSKALADIEARLDRIEGTVASYTADHMGWLIALQAITAVGMVRQISAAEDPHGLLEVCRQWSDSIVDSTHPAATIPAETADKIRTMAHEKVERFFKGISVQDSGA